MAESWEFCTECHRVVNRGDLDKDGLCVFCAPPASAEVLAKAAKPERGAGPLTAQVLRDNGGTD